MTDLNPVREAREILYFFVCNPTAPAFPIVERFNETFGVRLPVEQWFDNLVAIACDVEVLA
jgi:hypothetical protein